VGKTKQNDIWKIKKEKGDAGYIIIQDKWQGTDLWENCNYNDN